MYYYNKFFSREFGWWFQQIIKLGAVNQITNLSDPFVIWDADLIPIIKWDLLPTINSENYKFAILQEKSKNDWTKEQYFLSIQNLIGLESIEPPEGTFVPHHFIFHHKVIINLLNYIENFHKNNMTWIEILLCQSKTYYRFSEYKCVATFMNKYYPDLLKFHPFQLFGKSGIRIREPENIINKVTNKYEFINGISYENFLDYVNNNYQNIPSYIQIEDI